MEQELTALGYRVVGLDFSLEMLQAAARHSRHGLVQADAHLLPFASNCFDVVILPESLGHLQAGVAFQEAGRVLKTHGRLLITTYPKHREVHALYTKSSLKGLCGQLTQVGFRIKERKLLRPRQTLVEEVAQENRSALLYVLAVKQSSLRGQTGSTLMTAPGAA